jgi:LuxR family maltose regulon positive regulatory protein
MIGAAAVRQAESDGTVVRPRLLDRLSGPERLCILHADSPMGKSILLAQWATRSAGDLLWLDLHSRLVSRHGFWLRALTQLHASGRISDAVLSHEVAAIADSPASVAESVRRTIDTVIAPITLVIDGLPHGQEAEEAADSWGAVSRDLHDLLVSRPDIRCLVACRDGALVDALLHDAPFPVAVLTADDLVLSPEEARQIAAHDLLTSIPVVRKRGAAARDVTLRADSLRFRMHGTGKDGVASAEELYRLLVEEPGEERLRDFIGATAIAPAVDVELAGSLTDCDDAEELLRRLERRGAGAWTETAAGDRLFRYHDGVRQAAVADLTQRNASRIGELRMTVARWLAVHLHDYVPALEYVVESRDLALASETALSAFPFDNEGSLRIIELLRALPTGHVHRHPLFALWYGILLGADPAKQGKGAEFFVPAAAVGPLRQRSTPLVERAVMRGFESVIWRLTGHAKQMAEAAQKCLDLLDEAGASDVDHELAEIVGTVLYQCGISFYYAYRHASAQRAFGTLVAFSEDLGLRHRRNAGLSGLAFVDAISGYVNRARRTLDRIPDEDWPAPWRSGYNGALMRLAEAWVQLSGDAPQRAIDEMRELEPHFDSIEHWELILTVQVLAESRLGRSQEAAYRFARTRSSRLKRASLPSSVGRVVTADAVLDILTGNLTEGRRYGKVRSHQTFVNATEAISAAMRDDAAAATTLLRSADDTAIAPVQEMFVATAEVICSLRLGKDDGLHRLASRLTWLASDLGIRWPLALLAPADRERLLSALVAAGRPGSAQPLNDAFALVDPLISDAAWQASSTPTLSRREQIVLHALFTTGSRAQIAENLFVSVNTVKTQMRSLYAKLGVSTRDEVLARAIALGLATDPAADPAVQERAAQQPTR